MKQVGITIFVVAIVVVIGGLIYWALSGGVQQRLDAEIVSFEVADSDLVVTTRNVDSVRIFGVEARGVSATSTDATSTATTTDTELGSPELEEPDSDNGVQTWRLAIPDEPMQLSAIYAVAYNEDGEEIARETLPHMGPREIREQLWTQRSSTTITLGVGDTRDVTGATLTLEEVVDDTRCPSGETCVEEGGVTARFSLAPTSGQERSVTVKQGEQLETDGYVFDILSVQPAMPADGTVSADAYELRILAFRQAKG